MEPLPDRPVPATAPAPPRVAIVGRPNVGKSTLLNRLRGSRVSIVEPTAGVTRDRIAVPVRLPGPRGERWIELIDTGGIGIVDRHDLGPHVEAQVQVAVRAADLVLFVVDARDGLTPADHEVARRLRGIAPPVLLVANKAEGRDWAWQVDDFRRLGIAGEPVAVSAQNGEGVDLLVERVLELLPPAAEGEAPPPPEPTLKLAVVGRRNMGKSTLINRLAGEERMIVSEIPGTTRDSVDVLFERDGERLVAIDTAGVRRKTRIEDAVEYYSDARSYRTIRRADVVLLLFDATEDLSALDKRLARYALDHHKPLILCANKWDLVAEPVGAELVRYVRAELPGQAFAPVMLLSARTGEGVEEVLATARSLFEEARRRVGTGELNRVLERAAQGRSPSSRGQLVRILYGTQVGVAPPTFVVFVKDKRMVGQEWIRYLQNRLREELGLPRVPLQIIVRERRRDGRRAPSAARGAREDEDLGEFTGEEEEA